MAQTIRLIAVGGGSGGHIYPGISVIRHMESSGMITRQEVLWLCSFGDRDREILSACDIPFTAIPSGKLRRYASLKNILDIPRIAAGFAASMGILRKNRPRCLFSKGGYVSVPAVAAARILGIPVVSHESDLDPGLATRINQRFSSILCVPFAESRAYYPKTVRIEVTGNPIGRERKSGIPDVGINENPYILVHGGSLGSASLNTLIWACLERIPETWQVVHIVGTEEKRIPPDRAGYIPLAYAEGSFQELLDHCDIVVSRAGAGTLWEQAAAGKPMILLPLGRKGSRGEQERNAGYFCDHGAARVLFSGEAHHDALIYAILELIADGDVRSGLSACARELVHERGAELIARCISSYIER